MVLKSFTGIKEVNPKVMKLQMTVQEEERETKTLFT